MVPRGWRTAHGLAKDHPRIAAIGSADELNSHLGVLLAKNLPQEARAELLRIQHNLFDLGAMLASPGAPFDTGKLVHLDAVIARYNANLPPLKEFTCPAERVPPRCAMSRVALRGVRSTTFCSCRKTKQSRKRDCNISIDFRICCLCCAAY